MRHSYRGRLARNSNTCRRDAGGTALLLCAALVTACALHAGTTDLPPDPGLEASVKAADVIAEIEIIAGGPFRSAVLLKKALKGDAPKVFELEGYNSYNWDTVHQGFSTGGRFILFLSRTERPDVFATLTPAAPRLSIQQDGVLIALGDPPFRIPVKRASIEEGLALLLEANSSGKLPDRAGAFIARLWDEGDIESRYFAVALAGALRDGRAAQMLIDASRDKLLKLRLIALEALGKVGTPQTVQALRVLLKDERAAIAREAARILVEIRDVDALPALLEWARKALSATTTVVPKNGATDPNRLKTDAIASDAIRFAAEYGVLHEPGTLARPLMELAHLRGDNWPREALQAYVRLAHAEQIPALLEAAEDRTFDLYSQALSGLEHNTLKSFDTVAEFRRWWTGTSGKFGEEQRREIVEAAAKHLATLELGDDRRQYVEKLRRASGDIAVVSAAPLLLGAKTTDFLGADDLQAWRTPLAIPFLVERLGRDDITERRSALGALIALAVRQPRLKAALWPLLRAGLSDDDGSYRRVAQVGVGQLAQNEALPALLDAMQYQGGYESQDAGKALYAFTARTFGYSFNEPVADQAVAVQHLRGWVDAAGAKFVPVRPGMQLAPRPVWIDRDAAERAQLFERLVQHADSRISAAAFDVLLNERPPADPLWKKLTALPRQRDRAYGLLGQTGSDVSVVVDLARKLPGVEGNAEAPLAQALALVTLPTCKGGAEKVAEWLQGAGAKSDLPWRRLAIMALGMADNEPKSLAALSAVLDAGLNAKPPERDGFEIEKPSDEFALLRPAVYALSARSDSTTALMRALDKGRDRQLAELLSRALSLRRHRPAVASIVAALQRSDRFTWTNLARALQAFAQPADTAEIRKLLDCTENTARAAGAYILATTPHLGTDSETIAHLSTALNDNNNVVRYYCVQALGKRKAKEAVKRLINLLDDEDDDVRAGAAEALGAIGDAEGCAVAAKAALRELRIDTRWLRALAVVSGASQLELLMKLCNSSLYAEQRAGLEALGASNKPEALERIVKTYTNDESALQTVAANVLAEREAQAVTVLAAELESKDAAVRARAIHTLSRVKTPGSRQLLAKAAREDAEIPLRALAEFALKRLDSK